MNNKISRRNFLGKAALGTCGAVIHQMFAPLGGMMAYADPLNGANSNAILILINLAGGASHNISPIYDGTYRDRNPTISYGPENSLQLVPEQGLHPALTSFKEVWDGGDLALINMVGYPYPNRSHEESTAIWHRGMRKGAHEEGGWGAKLTCQLGNVFSGISLHGPTTLIRGECNPPRSFESLDALGERKLHWGDSADWLQVTRDDLITLSPLHSSKSGKFVHSQMDALRASLDIIQRETNIQLPTIANPFPASPRGFMQRCRDAAKLVVAKELRTQFIYLELDGFDTHSDEKRKLNELLTTLNQGLTPLIQTIKAAGRWNDVTLITMSEFCRTFENGSAGSDHGHAGPMFVLGGAVNGGIKSPLPAAAVTAGIEYYKDFQVDFRQVFQDSVRWMGLDPAAIFPETISHTGLGLF